MKVQTFLVAIAVLLVLTLSSACQAGETALVTQADGDGITARIGDISSWTPALGEVLPASVAITVETGSTLGLLHLFSNSELTVHGPKELSILADGFTGVDLGEPTKIESIAAALDLPASSLEMAGAVSSDRLNTEIKGEAKEIFNRSGVSKGLPDNLFDQEANSEETGGSDPSSQAAPSPAPESPPVLPETPKSKRSADLAIQGMTNMAPCKPKDQLDAPDTDVRRRQDPATIWLALPKSVFSVFSSMQGLKFFPTQAGAAPISFFPEELALATESWVLLTGTLPTADPIQGALGTEAAGPRTFECSITPNDERGLTVLAALIHESNKRFGQAAGIWLKLAQEGQVAPNLLATHLKRLLGKFQQK